MRTWLKRIGIALGVVLLVVVATLVWLLRTESGLHFALQQGIGASGGTLTVQQSSGHLGGPVTLRGVHYRSADGSVDVSVATLRVQLRVRALLAERAHLMEIDAQDVRVALTTPKLPAKDTAPLQISLHAPYDVILDRVHVADIRVQRDGQPVFVADTLDLAGAWRASGIELRQLKLRAPAGRVDLDGTLDLSHGYAGDSRGSFAWKIGDTTYAGGLVAHSDGRQAHVDVKLSQPMLATLALGAQQTAALPWTAKLDAPRFDPQPLLGDSSLKAVALALTGHGDRRGGKLTGRIQVNDIPFDVNPLAAHFDDAGTQWMLDDLSVTSPKIKGTVHASGTVHLRAQPVGADLALQWRDVVLPEALAGQVLASRGDITVTGSAAAYHVAGNVDIGPPGKLAKLSVDLDGTPQQIALHTLALKQPHGGLDASGTLVLQPQLGWDFTATADDLDPGLLLAGWNGALDIDLATHGQWRDAGPEATLQLRKLGGTLRQRALAGHGTLTLHPNRVVEGTLELRSGGSRMHVAATGTQRNDVALDLDVASLGDWLPDAGGRLHGQFRIRGLWPKLAVDGHLDGNALSYRDRRAASLQLQAAVPDISQPGGTLELRVADVAADGLSFDHVAIDGHGNAASHHLRIAASGQPLGVQLALNGRLRGKQWNGTLTTLDLDVQGLPPWRLQRPASLAWNDGVGSLSETCLSAGDPLLCVSAKRDKNGSLDAAYRLRQMPLALLTSLAGDSVPLRSEGVLEGDGSVHRSAAGALSGQARLDSPQGSISYADRPEQPLLRYHQLSVDAQLAPDRQHVVLTAALDEGGSLAGDATVSGAQRALAGHLHLRVDNLAFIELFSAEVASVKGQLDGDIRLGGTLAQPAFGGQAVLDRFAAELPSLGLKLHDGHVTLATDNTGRLHIDGQLQSGDGTLQIAGSTGVGAAADTDVQLTGSKLLAADIPAARLVVSPDLHLQRNAGGLDIGGTLGIDSADVNLAKLSGAGAGAVQASPDVVVVDAAQPQDQAQVAALPIHVDIRVDLGDKTHLAGFGLDGRVSGRLHVREMPGKVTTGEGQIGIDGIYKAYGQNLRIKQGRLLFAGTPIDNPGLDIRAVRTLNPNATIDEGQVVGLQIRGTAQRPVMTVFSNPPMEQSDALSYLITGKPLSQVKGGEGNMVGAAAQALGTAAGDLLAKRVGGRLGVDEIGVSSNEALGTAAFTVGKYLSPRLYLSYGVGLFEPGQVITLRYILSHRWNFEAQQATDFSRASFNYRLEK
jgi:translocation and assembly module TamB